MVLKEGPGGDAAPAYHCSADGDSTGSVDREYSIPELGFHTVRAPVWKYRGADRESLVNYQIPPDFTQPSTHMEYGWSGTAQPVGGEAASGTGQFAITVPNGH